MDRIIRRIRQEPVVIIGLVEAIIALVTAFGVDLSPGQTSAILGVAGSLLALVARNFTWSADKVQNELIDAETAVSER